MIFVFNSIYIKKNRKTETHTYREGERGRERERQTATCLPTPQVLKTTGLGQAEARGQEFDLSLPHGEWQSNELSLPLLLSKVGSHRELELEVETRLEPRTLVGTVDVPVVSSWPTWHPPPGGL